LTRFVYQKRKLLQGLVRRRLTGWGRGQRGLHELQGAPVSLERELGSYPISRLGSGRRKWRKGRHQKPQAVAAWRRGRHHRGYTQRSYAFYGRPRRPLLRAIICGAVIWALLPFGLMRVSQGIAGGTVSGEELPFFHIRQTASADKKTEDDNKKYIETLPEEWKNFSGNLEIKLWDHQRGSLLQLDLEEYVVGVVAAEMPASFDIEALKAQAVAARTYALRRITNGPAAQVAALHPEAQLTSDHNINQAWIDKKEREKRWGSNFPGNEAKIRQAVGETKGIILLYEGDLIDPLYHASCGGERTEDIKNVWGKELPYLQSVKCSGHADQYEKVEAVFSLAEVDEALGTGLNALPAAAFSGKGKEEACRVAAVTEAGRVLELVVAGKHFTGAEVRSRLNLPSAMFDVEVDKDKFKVVSRGYGHGVGMCQYGAADFAARGYNWRQILQHYYKGVQPARISQG